MNSNILKSLSKIAENENVSITQLEKEIGASKGVLSRAINKNTDIQSKWVEALVDRYPHYNADWILKGHGPMLLMGANSSNINEANVEYNKDGQLIPLYDVKGIDTIVDLLTGNSQAKFKPSDFIKIPNLPKCDGALPITGDSMYPLLKSGDIALYKEVQNFDNIIWGEMYLIALNHDGDEFFFARYLQKSEKADWVILVSQNTQHQPKEFPVSSIKALALIKASIRINTPY